MNFAEAGHYVGSLEENAIAELRRLVEINSFTRNREGVNRVVERVTELFEPLGFMARRVPSVTPECGDHLFLERGPEDAPGILMVTHNDTVYPPQQEERNDFRWREEGNRIHGPGVADIKGGTILVWMVLRALEATAPGILDAVRFKLAINATEEGGCEDFEGLALACVRTGDHACLVYEPGFELPDGSGSAVVVARKGAGRFRLDVHGKEAHSGNAHREGASAIVELAGLIRRLHTLTDYEREVTFNVGTISGGTAVNAVAGHACASVDVRAFTEADLLRACGRIRELEGPGEIVSADGNHRCRVEATQLPGYGPWEPCEASDLLGDLAAALGARLGQTILPQRRNGASDGCVFWRHLPTIDGLGPIGRNMHCSVHDPERGLEQESVERDSFVPRALLSLALIEKLVDGSA